MESLGKKYETKFKEDWEKVPGTSIDRLYDPVGGYSGISNISDFIVYNYPFIVYAECKTTKGNTFPFTNLKQFPRLVKKIGIKGVIAGVFIWFYEKDFVVFVPVETCKKMIEDGEKSINCKKIRESLYDAGYEFIEIPSVKKRVFMDSDYSVILRKEDIQDE